ncbi:hypothetical protein Dimus_032805 [Dionaea muscipula]
MNPFPSLSSLSSSPLFSSIVTLYTLILLYFPYSLLKILFSPVLISTAILLLSLLWLGAYQKTQQIQENGKPDQPQSESQSKPQHSSSSGQFTNSESGSGSSSDPKLSYAFVQWDVSAPLEVIYEAACEGEEEEDDGILKMEEETRPANMERYPSLSRYYPETDPDSEDDEIEEDGEWEFTGIGGWDSPDRVLFRCGDEEERDDGLIEIALDGGVRKVELEEENLIEIDFLRREPP